MTDVFTVICEILLYIALFGMASLITRPMRLPRRIRDAAPAERRWVKVLLDHVSRPITVLLLSKAVYLALPYVAMAGVWKGDRYVYYDAWFTFWLIVLTIRLVEGVIDCIYAGFNRPFPVPGLLRSIIRGAAILGVGFFVLKNNLDINIAPLLASTALLTAVVGFALQGVLGNLMSGMSLHVVRSALPGDWIAIDEVEGEVIETNWRETRLRTVAGHIMIVPNSRVASAIVHNMTWPNPTRRHSIEVGASYSDAPGEVIEALVEAASSVPGVLDDPKPTAYVTAYKDFGINYELRYWSRCYYNRVPLDGEVGRMIWYHFKRRGIEIPFPMSDKLLNDFMAVVYRQRRMPPGEKETEHLLEDLMRSDFIGRVFVDADGHPMLQRGELQPIAHLLKRVRFTRGETIFHQGEEGSACYVIVRGSAQGCVEYSDTREMNRFQLGPGAVLGEMSLTTGMPRTATLTAEGELEVIEISDTVLRHILALRPEMPEQLAALVAERAVRNADAYETIKSNRPVDVNRQFQQSTILSRFLHMLGKG
ncbi:MAG: mechanosensitive ion channel [Spartobacteria bacterium]|nr:mechanosensitive ion channel [Spartobacteria bacterium]